MKELYEIEDLEVVEEEFSNVEMCTACNGTSCSIVETGPPSTEEELVAIHA